MKLEAKLKVDALSFETSHWSRDSYWINSGRKKKNHQEAMLRVMAAKLTHIIQNIEMLE